MEKEKELRSRLKGICDKAIEEMLLNCKTGMDFAELEKQIEGMSHKLLPELLSASSEELAHFPPELSPL